MTINCDIKNSDVLTEQHALNILDVKNLGDIMTLNIQSSMAVIVTNCYRSISDEYKKLKTETNYFVVQFKTNSVGN